MEVSPRRVGCSLWVASSRVEPFSLARKEVSPMVALFFALFPWEDVGDGNTALHPLT
jgi:hypothetical protein